ILYATVEIDFKRLLAHSTIENMGLVALGIGAALTFRALGQTTFAAMALIAALLHLLNHSMAKSLMFLSAGAVDNAVGTRNLNALGGLMRLLPWVAGTCLVGCLMLAALPPSGGFASEWLLIQSLLRSAKLLPVSIRLSFAVAGALMALTVGLALATFTRLFAMGFLAMPRSEQARQARPVAASMRIALGILAAICLLLGLLPTYLVSGLDSVVHAQGLAGGGAALVPTFLGSGHTLAPDFVTSFHALGAQIGRGILPPPGLVLLNQGGTTNPVVFAAAPAYLDVAIAAALLVTWLVVRALSRGRKLQVRRAWDGGLPALPPQFTYTATGFGNPARVIFSHVLAPYSPEQREEHASKHFRVAIVREDRQPYVLDRWIFTPLMKATMRVADQLAGIHHGRLNGYMAYAIVTLLIALGIAYLG
ncbi:MAG: proton-conducting transporter membrane subunit, partial [Rhodanobacteraceae bacterium]